MRKLVLLAWLLSAGAAVGQDVPLSQVLIDGEEWKEVKLPRGTPEALAGAAGGQLFVAFAGESAQLLSLGKGGEVTEVTKPSSRINSLAFDAKGELYTSLPREPHVSARDLRQRQTRLVARAEARGIAVSPAGKVYYVDAKKKAVFLVGKEQPVAEDVGDPSGLVFWKDGSTLVVGDGAGKHLYAYRVGEEGTLDAKEKYYTLRVRPKEPSGVKALVIDNDRRLYAATNLGVQVFDPTGRLSGVINPPSREPVTAVAFAGEKRDRLFIVCGGKLWQRKTKATAAWPPDEK